jgi:hypothetical protein
LSILGSPERLSGIHSRFITVKGGSYWDLNGGLHVASKVPLPLRGSVEVRPIEAFEQP